jgi:hypothetical protein
MAISPIAHVHGSQESSEDGSSSRVSTAQWSG